MSIELFDDMKDHSTRTLELSFIAGSKAKVDAFFPISRLRSAGGSVSRLAPYRTDLPAAIINRGDFLRMQPMNFSTPAGL